MSDVTIPVGAAIGKTWEPTASLRWKATGQTFALKGELVAVGPVLEQAWRCLETGEIEWRAVETV